MNDTVIIEPTVYENTIEELLDKVLYGSYTPGVHDKELKERIALMGEQLKTGNELIDELTEQLYLTPEECEGISGER